MSELQADYDAAWKELLERQFPAFLAFFFPDAHADIDSREEWVAVEQELRPLTGESETGTRLADKLYKARTLEGDDNLFHVEVQGQPRPAFGRRVYVYGYRVDDRFGLPADHLVILTDDDPNWNPTEYAVRLRYSELSLKFVPVKLLRYAGREEEMLAHGNLVALFVQAHLWSRQTLGDVARRLECKLRLIRELVSRKLDDEDARHWHRYLDWLLPLAAEARAEYYRQLALLAREGTMATVFDLEEWAMQRVEKRVEEKVEAQIMAEKAVALAALSAERDLAAQERDAVAQERDRAAQERDRAAQERDRAAQERDRAAQERDRAAQERDRAAQRLLQAVLSLARARLGTDEVRGLLTGQPLPVVEAVSDALDAGASLDDIRKLIPAP